jgi:hypothetical protein
MQLFASEALNRLQVALLVGRQTTALRFPHCLRKQFNHLMLGIVFGPKAPRDIDESLANAGRSVGRDLVAHCEMQSHVKKGIGLTTFG